MPKPSEDIKMIYEEIRSGKKEAEAMTYNQMCAIIQAIIHYMDINEILEEERKKARNNESCISLPNLIPNEERFNATHRGDGSKKPQKKGRN